VRGIAVRIVVLPGDGIGPEISAAAVEVLGLVNRDLGLGLDFETHEIGLLRLKTSGTTFPAAVLERCREAGGVLLGPVAHSDYPGRAEGGINVSAELRIALDLYANIRPSRSRDGLAHYGRTAMDLVIVRENTEGFYADRNMHLGSGEFMPTPDLALSVRKITAAGSRRIAGAAFELAGSRRRKVTAVHKRNVLKVSEGLFLREVRKLAQEHPDVAYEEQLVDSAAALLVRDAARFDVIVTTNMFGDILSDEAAELSGSLGLAGSINAGDAHCMAQAQHGSAPDIAGRDLANPVSLVLSAAMLLDWMGRRHNNKHFARATETIDQSVDALLKDPATRTADLGGKLGTKAFTAALCSEIGGRLR
jgi:isocitrate/isopropylmalate dehydrogenase